MPSLNAINTAAFMGGGAAISGYLAYKYAKNRKDYDSNDTMASTTSLAIGGAAAGLALKYVGLGRVAKLGGIVGSTGYKVGKLMTANPIRAAMRAMGRTRFGWSSAPGLLKGVMGITAATVVGAGAIAYSYKGQGETTEYGSRGTAGQTEYNTQSIKERMGLLGATGDMVFGLNNLRHG